MQKNLGGSFIKCSSSEEREGAGITNKVTVTAQELVDMGS